MLRDDKKWLTYFYPTFPPWLIGVKPETALVHKIPPRSPVAYGTFSLPHEWIEV